MKLKKIKEIIYTGYLGTYNPNVHDYDPKELQDVSKAESAYTLTWVIATIALSIFSIVYLFKIPFFSGLSVPITIPMGMTVFILVGAILYKLFNLDAIDAPVVSLQARKLNNISVADDVKTVLASTESLILAKLFTVDQPRSEVTIYYLVTGNYLFIHGPSQQVKDYNNLIKSLASSKLARDRSHQILLENDKLRKKLAQSVTITTEGKKAVRLFASEDMNKDYEAYMKSFNEYCNLVTNAKKLEDKANTAKQTVERYQEVDNLRTLINSNIENTYNTDKKA